ncbi:hypothetical protein H4684_003131 [Desulfomicrobium macestii]|uniref:Uncharacterized protein n=1 Tax=Desulfomicrobium macestii TaxID=90731 RepID=A0ABR9H6Z0_9BACT|nr:hypothetical protein [Desulfomicrobium macestii]MBE1426465.1 hypothetical protein [Desulfomicrobium macestii]
MKKVRLTEEKCRSSVFARHEALKQAIKSIKTAPKALTTACNSSVALASLDLPEIGICRLGSRNTLFKYSDILFSDHYTPNGETGWKYIDWLRNEVKDLAKKEALARNKKSRELIMAEKLNRAQQELSALQRTMMAQTKAYLWILKEVFGLSKSHTIDDSTKHRLKNLITNHDELFGDLFTPNMSQSKVIKLKIHE